jgi:DNA-binding winged helix-turn-helix (wHTH) protein
MIYAFGDFELDEERYELRCTGVPVKLEPKAFRVLAYLILHRDRVVTRDELREQFWPGEFVTDSALAHCVVKARQAADDGGAAQRVIKTVHGHGYRFIRGKHLSGSLGWCRPFWPVRQAWAHSSCSPPLPPKLRFMKAGKPAIKSSHNRHARRIGASYIS